MEFDWKSIVSTIAPTIATALGGPLAGAGVAAASGVASLNSSSKVVQNPASATTTPAAGSIPLTGAGTTLDAAWIPTLNQSTSGTAANLSGTPALPNGTGNEQAKTTGNSAISSGGTISSE
jgi:hypothetical protein